MNRAFLFLKLYRKKRAENTILFVLFSMLGAVIAMVLFVQAYHASLFKNQLVNSGFADEMNTPEVFEGFSVAYQNTENILGIIAIAAIFIGAAGGLCLIAFRNQSAEKAMVMMHIFGMQKKDIMIKAGIDALFYAVMSSSAGHIAGYFVFMHFAERILQSETGLRLFSLPSLFVYIKALGLIVFIVFFGNLYVDYRMTEKAVTNFLYQRQGREAGRLHVYILMMEMVGIALYALTVFHVKKDYLIISGLVTMILMLVLFALFHLFFGVSTKKRIRCSGRLSSRDRQIIISTFMFPPVLF